MPVATEHRQGLVVNLQEGNKKKNVVTVKGGLMLGFVPEEEGEEETCMEERRATLVRYRVLLTQALHRT